MVRMQGGLARGSRGLVLEDLPKPGTPMGVHESRELDPVDKGLAGLRPEPRQLGRLPDPLGKLLFVDGFAFLDVDASLLLSNAAWRNWFQRSAPVEVELDIRLEGAQDGEEAVSFDAVDGGMPLDGPLHVGDLFGDDGVDAFGEA